MPLRINHLATLTHTTEGPFRFDKVADRLDDPPDPPGCGAQAEILEIRS
jgi:hypothetical protein